MAVTIYDIAKATNTTYATVSRALNNHPKISAKTKSLVLETARQMGYRSNYWAKSLSSQKSKLIGVLFPDITGSAANQTTQGIQEILDQRDYENVLAVSFWNPAKERKEVEMMLEKRVEGIIAVPQAYSQETYQIALDAGCPVVIVGDWLPGLSASSVYLDSEDSMYKLLNHLHQLGRRNIHLLTVKYNSQALVEREEAFKTGLMKLGLPFDPDHIYYANLAQEMSVYEQARRIMERKDRADALVCIYDAVALQALSELTRLQVKIPEDLAVASIGNLEFSGHPYFNLTTVDECRTELGRQAANLLFRQIEANTANVKSEQIRIKGSLITRQSTVGGNRILP